MVWLAGRIFWVRPISLEAMGILLAWLDDVLPGRADRTCLPEYSDDASQEMLRSPTGQAIVRWLALRDQGISFAEASSLHAENDDDQAIEITRLYQVLFERRRTYEPGPLSSDVSEIWCGPGLVTMAKDLGMDAVRALTMDQFEWFASGGSCDEQSSPEMLGYNRAVELYKAAVEGNGDTAPTMPPPPEFRVKED